VLKFFVLKEVLMRQSLDFFIGKTLTISPSGVSSETFELIQRFYQTDLGKSASYAALSPVLALNASSQPTRSQKSGAAWV
jgi:hypothetical protein